MASGLVDEDDEATPGFDFVPSQDIAAQAALLAVSSFDRAQLKSLCVDDAAYKTTLAQRGSVAAKDVVEVCYAGDYAKALSFIAALGDELALDPVLAPHSTTLKEKAVDRLIAQYCKPYKTVDLARMASAFSLEQARSKIASRGWLVVDAGRPARRSRGPRAAVVYIIKKGPLH